MSRRNDFIVLGIILLIVASGLFYYTTNPIERTYTAQEYVTKERVILKERTVPHETLVKKTREVIVYSNSTLADSYKDFEVNEFMIIAEPVLKPGNRIKYTITTDITTSDLERWFHFVILDSDNYNLWLTNESHAALFVNEIGEYGEIPLVGIWTVPASAGTRQFEIIISNKHFVYPKRIKYTIIKQEAYFTSQEYTQKITEMITETYEEKEPYQELETVTKKAVVFLDEYRPMSYILGAFGILAIMVGLLSDTQREKIKRVRELRHVIRGKYRQQDIPKCPNCGSTVIDTHIIEDRVELYKCANCQHLFEMK